MIRKIVAIILVLIIAAVVVGVLAMFAVLHDYEHTKTRCGNCQSYDESLHTCWPKFESRLGGDKGCDFFKPREDEK